MGVSHNFLTSVNSAITSSAGMSGESPSLWCSVATPQWTASLRTSRANCSRLNTTGAAAAEVVTCATAAAKAS